MIPRPARPASDTADPHVHRVIISFFVLAIFWFSHHRLFHYVRVVDGPPCG